MDNSTTQLTPDPVGGWDRLEAETIDLLRSHSAPDDLITKACIAMKPIYMENLKPIVLPGSTPVEALEPIRRYVHEMFMGLFQEILALEISLYLKDKQVCG